MKHKDKLKQIIQAADKKEGYLVEKLTKSILASKINDLIEQKRKEIKLG